MSAPLIRRPALEFAAGETIRFQLSPLTLPTGRAVTDYNSFVLTIRRDPLWPREGPARAAADMADPLGDEWEVVVSATGALNDDEVPEITFVMPVAAGIDRYAIDVWGIIDTAEVMLVRTTWLTAGGRVKALS